MENPKQENAVQIGNTTFYVTSVFSGTVQLEYLIKRLIQKEIEQEIAFAKEARKERAQAISAVQNPRYRAVLQMYYIGGMSFFKISCVLGKSERNIQDIHRKAIKQIEGENID